MEVLQAKDLKKIYGSGNNAVHALDGVDLSVKKGEFVAIVGTSGSGKSTLLHMLGGLDRPTSGTVMVDGQEYFLPEGGSSDYFPPQKNRFCISELQSCSGAECI